MSIEERNESVAEQIQNLNDQIAKLQSELALKYTSQEIKMHDSDHKRRLPVVNLKKQAALLRLVLVSVAKSSGGDKYLIDGDLGATIKKDRFIYVPQNISRRAGKPSPTIVFDIQHGGTTDSIAFTMLKSAAGSGDDRYTPRDKTQWEGDIYLPKSIAGDEIFLSEVK